MKLPLFAVTAPGLEEIAASELRALGLAQTELTPGGVAFEGGDDALWRANLELRSVGRVLLRIGEFGARGLEELRRRAARLPWERFFSPGDAVALRVSCHKSRLYHSGAVAERVERALAERLGFVPERLRAVAEDADAPRSAAEPRVQLVLVRLDHDRCTVSVDSSGEPLHRRGYRLAGATCAAARDAGRRAAPRSRLGWRDGALRSLLRRRDPADRSGAPGAPPRARARPRLRLHGVEGLRRRALRGAPRRRGRTCARRTRRAGDRRVRPGRRRHRRRQRQRRARRGLGGADALAPRALRCGAAGGPGPRAQQSPARRPPRPRPRPAGSLRAPGSGAAGALSGLARRAALAGPRLWGAAGLRLEPRLSVLHGGLRLTLATGTVPEAG